MNNLAVITAHCDIKDKSQILSNNLDKLLTIPNLKILLVSYLPVSDEIISKVDYFIYDKSNPVYKWPKKAFFKYCDVEDVRLLSFDDDYGWAIANKLKLVGNLLSAEKGKYEGVYLMNYDVVLDTELIEFMRNEPPQNTKFGGVHWNGWKQPTTMVFRSFLFKDFIKVTSGMEEEEYISFHNTIENYMVKRVEDEGIDCKQHGFIVKDQCDWAGKLDPYNIIPKGLGFKLFISVSEFNDPLSRHNHSFFYKIEKDIKILVNGGNFFHLKKGENFRYHFKVTKLDVLMGDSYIPIPIRQDTNKFLKKII